MLELLQMSSLNLLELINSVLEYNKVEAGKLILEENPFDLHKLLRQMVDVLQPQAKINNLTLNLSISDDTPKYYIGDMVKIKQILTNLIGNSLKFTLEGKVEIHLNSKPDLLNKRYLEFKIIDTGIGMSEDEIKEIFEPFSQANETINKTFGGTGLGLSISQKILQAYNSKLEVESEKGKGATFTFALRLKLFDSPEKLDQATNTVQLENLSHIRLLVVDDSFSNHFIINRLLNKWEVKYRQAHSGREALSLVKEYDFDVILMDLKMPDMDGFEATRRIRSMPEQKYKEIPIIAYSAAASSQITEEMNDAGMNDLILKPFRAESLHRLLLEYGKNADTEKPKMENIQSPEISFEKPEHFNPTMEVVEEMFEDDKESKEKYLNAVIKDLRTLKGKFTKIQVESIVTQEAFLDICHSAKTIIRMFKLNDLKQIFDKGEKELSENKLDEAFESLEEIVLFIDNFSMWVKSQIED
jgi:CheY-like chemotaxis protein